VCCECYVLSGRGPCDELITRPEESYRLRCVVVYDLEKITLMNENEGQDPLGGYRAKRKNKTLKLRLIICGILTPEIVESRCKATFKYIFREGPYIRKSLQSHP